MLITRTTPVQSYHDSYVVEIKTVNFRGENPCYLTLGPFKRVPHSENLKHLLTTLQTVKADGDAENYHWVLGFSQWFNPEITNFEELDDYYSFSAADFHPEEEHEEAFALSRGFAKWWPADPSASDFYYQTFQEFKVFYYDYNGNKYNTEVTL